MQSDLQSYSAVVVDDEELVRTHISLLLREAGVGKVLQAGSGIECLRLFETEASPPDWAFLDIQMPGMDGLILADTLTAREGAFNAPAIVFVTGYDNYAVQAFELAALDYLLKPVTRERLSATLSRLSSRAEASSRPALPVPKLQRLPIHLDYAVRLVDIEEILAATAREKRVDVITRETSYSTYYTLNELEERLPADRFVRVHESWIVSLPEVLEIHNLGSQTYQIRLRSSERLIPVSRRRLSILQERLGL